MLRGQEELHYAEDQKGQSIPGDEKQIARPQACAKAEWRPRQRGSGRGTMEGGRL